MTKKKQQINKWENETNIQLKIELRVSNFKWIKIINVEIQFQNSQQNELNLTVIILSKYFVQTKQCDVLAVILYQLVNRRIKY